MSFSFDKFLRPLTSTDRNIKIYEDNGILKYTINPFHIKNMNVLNNTMRINLDSDRSIVMVFSTNNEAKISLKRLQEEHIDVLTQKVPFIIDKDILNYVTANIQRGPTGSNGRIFTGTSSTYLAIPTSGSFVQITTQKDLAFVPGQTIVVYKDFPTNYYVADYLDEPYYEYSDPVYMIGDVDTYNSATGQLAFVANICQPTGATSSFWYINLTGQRGQDGTSGTSGASAYQTWLDVNGRDPLAFSEQDFLDDIKGAKGEQGFEGLAGVNGTDGTSGTSGTSGASAYQTWLSVGGRDPLAFSEQDFLDDIKGAQGAQGFEGMQGPRGETGSMPSPGNGLILTGTTMSIGGTLSETLSIRGEYNDLILSGLDNISMTSSVFDVVSNLISLDSDDTQILAINDITISAAGQLALTGDSGLVVIGNTQGLVYQSDYSTGFVPNSLVSKKYVDDNIPSGATGPTGSAGTSGTSGIDGTSGTSGTSGISPNISYVITDAGYANFISGNYYFNMSAVLGQYSFVAGNIVTITNNLTGDKMSGVVNYYIDALGGIFQMSIAPSYTTAGFPGAGDFTITLSGLAGVDGAQGPVGPQGQSSNLFYYKGNTASTSNSNPGAGFITWNATGQTGSTSLYVNKYEEDGTDLDIFLALIINGQEIIIQDRDASGNYQKWVVSGDTTFWLSNYWEIPITYVDSNGLGTSNFPDNHNLFLAIFNASGTSGTSGINGTNGTSGTSGTSGTTPTTDWTLSGSLSVSGTSSLSGHTILSETSETINVTPGATASTVVYDFSTGGIWYHATASTNYTANFTNLPTDNNRAITATIIISQGATPYIPTAIQIGGTASVIKWAGGTASGTANKLDIVGFTFVRAGSVWAQVLGQISYFG